MKVIFHVDMNSFFASCEQVKNPKLLNQPIIVVGDPDRRSGIVLAASYEAKAHQIKTTMPIYQARKLLPQVIIVPSDYRFYVKMSEQVMQIFDDFTPVKEPASIDEAYLDMTGTEHLFGQPKQAAAQLMERVSTELGLGCSIGISSNKLLAKMASDMKKPRGITELYPEQVPDKLWPLPVGQLYGIGRKSVPKLNSMGIKTIGDLAKVERERLVLGFGPKHSDYMINSANGMGSDQVDPNAYAEAKSIGNELTYRQDLTEYEKIKDEILLLSDTVSYRLRRKNLKGKTISLKIKYNDFTVATRSKSLYNGTANTNQIFETGLDLLHQHWSRKPIRLLGIAVSHFEANQQLSLFGQENEKKEDADKMVDQLRGKYGFGIVTRGSIQSRKHNKI